MWKLIRILSWLRWRYFWLTGWKKRVGVVLVTFASLFFAAWISFGLFTVLRSMREQKIDPVVAAEFITLGSFILYAGWLYVGSYNDLYDPQKLGPYPVAPRRLFIAACISCVVGVTPLFIIGIVLATILGLRGELLLQISRSAWIILLGVHLVMLSRVFRLVFLQILTSRRWREFAGVAGVILSGIVWFGMSTMRKIEKSDTFREVIDWITDHGSSGDFSIWLCWSPSTWWSWAFHMNGARAVGGAVLFLAFTAFVAFAGGVAEGKLAFSEPVFAYSPKVPAVNAPRRRFLRGWPAKLLKIFGADVAAVARKEVCILSRDPLIRMRFISSAFMLLLIGVMPFITKKRMMSASGGAIDMALIFTELSFLFNLFGTDGLALRALFISPMSRARILFAKSVTYIAVFLPFNIIILSIVAYLAGGKFSLGHEISFHICYFLIALAAGHLFSLFFPSRVVQVGRRVQRETDTNPVVRMLTGFAALLSVGVAAVPIGLAQYLAIPYYGPIGQLVIIGISSVYALVLYGASLAVCGSLLTSREDKLVAFFTQNG